MAEHNSVEDSGTPEPGPYDGLRYHNMSYSTSDMDTTSTYKLPYTAKTTSTSVEIPVHRSEEGPKGLPIHVVPEGEIQAAEEESKRFSGYEFGGGESLSSDEPPLQK